MNKIKITTQAYAVLDKINELVKQLPENSELRRYYLDVAEDILQDAILRAEWYENSNE